MFPFIFDNFAGSPGIVASLIILMDPIILNNLPPIN